MTTDGFGADRLTLDRRKRAGQGNNAKAAVETTNVLTNWLGLGADQATGLHNDSII